METTARTRRICASSSTIGSDDFDWRAQERALNRFEHYRASIDGTRIHFVHARSRDPNAIPLLLLHGWPSSFVQMLDIIPLLTDPAAHGLPNAPSFHVVAASLPGFGFSDVPTRPGVGFATSAELMAKLMHDVLGYERYGVRGSDSAASSSGRWRCCIPSKSSACT